MVFPWPASLMIFLGKRLAHFRVAKSAQSLLVFTSCLDLKVRGPGNDKGNHFSSFESL